MTTDLDTRLHTGAGALHRAVADLPTDAPPRPSGRSPVVLGVVLLVVAAVTVAVVGAASRSGDGGIDVSATPVADVKGLIASPVPQGFQVSWVGQQSASAAAAAGAAGAGSGVGTGGSGLVEGQAMGLDTYLYGDADAAVAYPFASSDLVVNLWDASELTSDAAARTTDALDGLANTAAGTVRGHAAQVCAAPDCVVDGDADVTTVWWHETDDLEVVLASRSLTADQVVAVADGLTIQQEDVVLGALPAGLPGPLDEVGHLHDAAVATTRDAVAHWVGYTDPANATGRFVDVTTLAGDSAELMALVWELGADQQVNVRGTDGWLATVDSGIAASGDATTALPQLDLVWQEASGVLVHVTSLGVDKTDVLNLVEGLHAASDAEWQEVTDIATNAGAGAEAHGTNAQAGAGAQVDAGAASASAGAGASASTGSSDGTGAGAQVDAGVTADAGVAQVGADLHADLGTEAVIGAVQETVDQTAAATAQAGAKLEEGARKVPGGDKLLP